MDGGVAESDTSTDNESSNVQESAFGNHRDRLYYFNQMRGLQVIDLSFPDNPEVSARYRLPASGEQMYVTDNGRYAQSFEKAISCGLISQKSEYWKLMNRKSLKLIDWNLVVITKKAIDWW